jgi:mono/diheme cytochrome c family protein
MRCLAFLVAVTAACRTAPLEPPPQPPKPAPAAAVETPKPPADPALLARGAYVAALAGCKACHSPMKNGAIDSTQPFAGGLEVAMPSGEIWRAPNISPDRNSGIGNWSDTQVITAMRRGVRPDGNKLVPIMPYAYYHRMTDADAKAVVAFLRTQRPIYNVVARSDVKMAAIDLTEPVDNVDEFDDPKSHGEYLASIMHCAACHTPKDGPQANVTFAGGVTLPKEGGTIVSSNITPDVTTGIGGWSDDEIIMAIRTGKTPKGTIEGPMAMYVDGWSTLEDADAQALVAYIRSLQPANHNILDQQGPVVSR